jgi:hypothetical protein
VLTDGSCISKFSRGLLRNHVSLARNAHPGNWPTTLPLPRLPRPLLYRFFKLDPLAIRSSPSLGDTGKSK